jgi:hypothetical protein
MGGFYLGGVQELLIGKGIGALPWYRGITREQAILMGCGYWLYPLLLIIPSLLILQAIPKRKPTFRIVKSNAAKYSNVG